MKLGPVTKLDKRNMITLKKFDDDVISANCDVIVFFQFYGKISAIRKSDSGRIVYKTYIFINNNFLFKKNWKQNQQISYTALMLLLWVKGPFLPKNTNFLLKQRRSWY